RVEEPVWQSVSEIDSARKLLQDKRVSQRIKGLDKLNTFARQSRLADGNLIQEMVAGVIVEQSAQLRQNSMATRDQSEQPGDIESSYVIRVGINILRNRAQWRKPPTDALDLSEALLYRQDLSGMDLSGALLIKTNFQDANLSNADFSHTTLVGADFKGAVLRGANLNDADLSGALISRADLRDVDFASAEGIGTVRGGDNRCNVEFPIKDFCLSSTKL
ncbi:MAG: pentapeptide repeat-containing protein, partial [Pseudomonadales bacterium]|nr:pentapeptide repeat-containing protein [Pseudomonadales bacterium]